MSVDGTEEGDKSKTRKWWQIQVKTGLIIL